MVFNATFNNISVISWQSVLLVEETVVPRENLIWESSHNASAIKLFLIIAKMNLVGKQLNMNKQIFISNHVFFLALIETFTSCMINLWDKCSFYCGKYVSVK